MGAPAGILACRSAAWRAVGRSPDGDQRGLLPYPGGVPLDDVFLSLTDHYPAAFPHARASHARTSAPALPLPLRRTSRVQWRPAEREKPPTGARPRSSVGPPSSAAPNWLI